jgi:hypothetical protein
MVLSFRVASGVNLLCGVPAYITSSQKFFEKMYGPAEVQTFAKQNPETFKSIMREMSVFMGFSVYTRAPLVEFINSKTGTLTVVGDGGEFTMSNAAKILTPKQLKAENPLLVINPAICLISKEGISISAEFSGETRRFLKLYWNVSSSSGWYAGINGALKGIPSNQSKKRALYFAFHSAFGSLWRGGSLGDYGDGRVVSVGGKLGLRGGVLVQVDPATQAQPKEAKTTLLSAVQEQEAHVRMTYLACNGLLP